MRVYLSSIIGPASIIQIVPALGFFSTFLVSVFYYAMQDTRYPIEHPLLPLFFFFFHALFFGFGVLLQKKLPPRETISLRRGAWIVFWSWIIACSISGLYFVASGVPIPQGDIHFSFTRQFVDGFFESMSGYTTTGASILPSVEAFPRSMLFWRTLMHWIGGMGIAYLAVTLWKQFRSSRQSIINSETEAHEIVFFASQEEARSSGWSFLKAYSLLSLVLLILLFLSGLLFRTTPYTAWYDNIYDALVHTFSTIGTGGFSSYDLSAGLPDAVGTFHSGGLQNPVSEWILAFFMLFSGVNFSLWYILFFGKEKQLFWKNTEHRVYWSYVLLCTLGIAFFLSRSHVYDTVEQTLRYAFFNVATVVSTTGLGNWDFARWPDAAIAILFICYLIGGMVGSTGGGIKVIRYIVSYKHIKRQLRHLIYGRDHGHFYVDGVEYGARKSAMVLTTMAIYFFVFIVGSVLLLLVSDTGTLPDGSTATLSFGTAMAASIANLGNVGPAISYDNGFTIGPTGNYYAFTTAGKIILIVLMYIGRVGVLAVLMLFLKSQGERMLSESVTTVKFDEERPVLRQ